MNRSQATSQKVDSPKLKGRDSQNPRITTDFIAVEKQENAFKSRRKEFESKAIKNSDYASGSDELSPIGTDSRKFQQKKAYVGTPVLPIVQKSIVSNLRFVRTRPQHWSQGQRCTGRIGEQRESQKGQSDAQILIVETNELRRVSSKNTLVTMPLPGAAVARRFAREGFTVAVARYSLPHLVTITTAEERL